MRLRLLLLCALVLPLAVPIAGAAVAEDRDPSEIFFPVQVTDSLRYVDSYGDCRGSGCSRGHLGVDLMSDQMTPAFASVGGTVFAYNDYCNSDGTYCSYYLLISGDDGRSYFYVHLNDDTPGRPNGCDHAGGFDNAVSPRLYDAYRAGNLEGLRVERGEHIGYVGSSGNAGCAVDHIHYEIWEGHGWDTHYSGSQNPYPPVRRAHDAGNFNGPQWGTVEPDEFERIAGEDRIATAIELSRDGFDRADAVVIAPADQFAEALVGAPLAAAMDAPVLLTWPGTTEDRDVLDDRVAEEIQRLDASYAIVVGSEDRIGRDLEGKLVARTQLESDQVRRVGGDTVAATSAEVARLVLASQGIDTTPAPADEDARADEGTEEQEPTTDEGGTEEGDDLPPPLAARRAEARESGDEASVQPFLAAGTHPEDKGWPDALAASVLGSRQLAPILLTDFAELPAEVAAVLDLDGVDEVRITGGEIAVSADVEEQVGDLGVATRRLAGGTRYETALAVAAETIADGATLDTVALATGQNFPDALAAGPVLGRTDRPLVLVAHDADVASVTDFFRTHADDVDRVQAIGGPVAISDAQLRRTATSANHRYE